MADNTHYVDGEVLERELVVFNQTFVDDVKKVMKEKKLTLKHAEKMAKGYISEELGVMFMNIAHNLSNKNNFNNYTFKEEMIGLGIEYLCRFARKYNKDNPKANPFSYCTTICYHGFQQAITKEKKKSDLKDRIIKQAMQESEQDKWFKEEKGFMYEDDDYR